jgi:hypothetical protein
MGHIYQISQLFVTASRFEHYPVATVAMYRPDMNFSVFTHRRLWLQETASTTADTRQPMGADQEERAIVVVAADGAPVKIKAVAALQLAVQRVRERVHHKVRASRREQQPRPPMRS